MDRSVPPEQVRVSDAQCLVAVELLGRGFAAGCLSATEFDERATAVWAARTRGELVAPVQTLMIANVRSGWQRL
jgi:hypothetical protein